MNKRILILNIIVGVISLILLVRGINLITNSAKIVVKWYKTDDFDDVNLYLSGTLNVLKHYIEVIKIKGLVFSVFGLCGFFISFIYINKEMAK